MEVSSITCLLPVMNETISLLLTVTHLESTVGKYIKEYLIITSKYTKPESMKTCKLLEKKITGKIKIHRQEKPCLGGALQEGIQLAKGKYILLMASDLETDPRTVKPMIEMFDKTNADIVIATRWKNGGFRKYNPLKYVLNYFFQKIFRVLYAVNLSDLSYAFRLYKAELLKMFTWEELRHPFLLECMVKPLRFDIKIIEVSTVWRARIEGESSNTFVRNFEYIKVGIKYRFCDPINFVKPSYRHYLKRRK